MVVLCVIMAKTFISAFFPKTIRKEDLSKFKKKAFITFEYELIVVVVSRWTEVLVFVMYQAKIQKHQAFEAEVAAHANAIQVLDQTGNEMISQQHFASEIIRVSQCLRFSTLHDVEIVDISFCLAL